LLGQFAPRGSAAVGRQARRRLSGGRVDAEPVAEPEVIPRVVEVLAAGLLRAGWLPLLVDVGPEQVLGAEERAGREVEHQELIRRCPAGEAGRPRQRRQAGAGWRAEQQCRGQVRLDAGLSGRRELGRRHPVCRGGCRRGQRRAAGQRGGHRSGGDSCFGAHSRLFHDCLFSFLMLLSTFAFLGRAG